jgi:hypothetical protein
MFSFNGNFIGYNICNQTEYYSGTDTEDLYNSNLQTQSSDWYYYNNPITYSYNEYGHRSKSINELDFDNYILFIGCSHTEGIGLHQENTYANLVSTKLNCDYYNLACGGSGLDILFYNIVSWFNTFDKLPKKVVIQWPNTVRFAALDDSGLLAPKGAWSREEDIQRFLAIGEEYNYFYTKSKLTYKMILNLIDTSKLIIVNPYFNKFNFLADAKFKFPAGSTHPVINFNIGDFARDFSHPGIQTNISISQRILSYLE